MSFFLAHKNERTYRENTLLSTPASRNHRDCGSFSFTLLFSPSAPFKPVGADADATIPLHRE